MNKTKRWITILLALAALVLMVVSQHDKNDAKIETISIGAPTYKIDHTDTVVYNSEGTLNYRLLSKHVEYFSNSEISCFTQPVITTFSNDNMPIWSIKSDRAKLKNNTLYLCGHVEAKSLIPNALIQKILTKNAQVNLVTQDVMSQDLVTLYGKKFNSIALKMHGNLRRKSAELIEKVRTFYDMQNR